MGALQALQAFLPAFERFYNVHQENVLSPFYALAEFHSHTEQYLLVKAAKIADIDSNDYAYFYAQESGPEQDFISGLCTKAWEDAMGKINPGYGHRNSDVTVFVFVPEVSKEVSKEIKKISNYKSYKHGLYGWSKLRLVVQSVNDGKLHCNWQGRELRYLFAKKNCKK